MQQIESILHSVEQIGGQLWVEGEDQLKGKFPTGKLSQELHQEIKKNKSLIIQRMKNKNNRLEMVLNRLNGMIRKSSKGYLACCPAHDDSNPSLSIWENDEGEIVLKCFAGCSRFSILQKLNISLMDLQPNEKAQGEWDSPRAYVKKTRLVNDIKKLEQFQDRGEVAKKYCEQLVEGSVAAKYLQARGIPLKIAKKYGLGFASDRDMKGWRWGRITVPHATPDGKVVNIYARVIGEVNKIKSHQQDYFKNIKHRHLSGSKGVFNAKALKEDTIIIAEGAFDCLSLILSGHPNSCAIFGLDGLRWDWIKAKHIIFALDNDEAGQSAWEKIKEEAKTHDKHVSRLDKSAYKGCKDLNEVLIKHGRIDLEFDEQKTIDNKEPDPFVQLHLHSQMSTLDGIASTKEIVARAKELNQNAVALTNHGNMVDHIDFIEDCETEGIKPIVGNEVYFVPDRFHREGKGEKRKAYHLILLAMNDVGLKNLYRLTSEAYETGFHYKPRIDWDLLEQYNEGIICTAACLGGYPQQLLLNNDLEGARSAIQRFKNIFGNRYYLEMQPNDYEEQSLVNQQFIEWSKELDIPLVATMDSHHLSPKTYELHKLFTQIGTGDDFIHDYKDNFWTTSSDVVDKLVTQTGVNREIAEIAARNTTLVANRVSKYTLDTSVKLPHYPIPKGFQSESEYLNHLCNIGWNKRGIHKFSKAKQQQYRERLKTELDVILDKGFEGYFLIVWDMINWAQEQSIPVGYGRGSAGGSLVSWLLGIVELDPIKYGLLFERFLNPERKSLPDIDVDFSHDRRGEIIDYLKDKYGHENVMPILTLGTMGASMALRDIGRVLKVPLSEVNKVAKRLEELKQEVDEKELDYSILDELLRVKEVKKIVSKYPQWIDAAKQLEGRVRHFGKHASAILIADRPIKEVLPLIRVKGELTAMGDMSVCEKLGLVKFDILGLKTLDVISNTVQLIKETHKNEIDVLALPEGDKKAYRMLGKAESAGVFQMDKDGAKRLLSDLKPKEFNDLVAINALNRPAPLRTKGDDGLSIAERYVKVRNGEIQPVYLHPDLKPILKNTSGQLIYQEQMMQIVGKFAGFSLAERSESQKVISKKKKEKLQEYQGKFIEGCKQNGYSEEIAKELWSWIEQGASYLFNRSHSASYALLAYQTAYLKAHYPVEFAASLLSVYRDDDKFYDMLTEARKKGITIVPPLINQAGKGFKTNGGQILWGLESIKGVGKAYDQIIENRPYTSFCDFLDKNTFKGSKVNKRVIVALVKAGAFDGLGDRIELMQMYQETRPKREREQKPLITKEQAAKATLTKYQWEQEVLGDTLTEHPLESQLEDKQTGGEIVKIKKIKTRKGDPMAFISVNSPQGHQDLTVFPKQYQQFKSLLKKGTWIVADVKHNQRGAVANKITEVLL